MTAAGTQMRVAERFEYTTGEDPWRNYCLWDYTPAAPGIDKFRSINLLFQSFEFAGMDERAFAIVDAIRDAIGPFRTVFGVKLVDGRLGWEFYFYDYMRRERDVSISRVLKAIRPFIRCDVVARESLPYFMFSLDLNEALVRRERDMDVVHMYVGNPGSTVSSGVSYGIRVDGTTLENFYFFFEARRQMEEVAGKVCASAVFDSSRIPVESVVVPQLRDCTKICVANKQSNDCIYFSGITVDQLIFFMNRLAYPDPIRSFIESNRRNLDHLLFDVGFDYRMQDGRLVLVKSGYYGVF